MPKTDTSPLPIQILIEDRCQDLGLGRADLVRRAGYKNIGKGIRRLEALVRGDLTTTKSLIDALPVALGIAPDVVRRAIEETRRAIEETETRARAEAEAAWRAEFTPHAIILGERRVPEPIFVAAFIGVNRILRVDFDATGDREDYPAKALAGVQQRLAEFNGMLPAFGRALGFVLNYSPDCAIKYSLNGVPQHCFDAAYRVGDAELLVNGKPIPPGLLPRVVVSGDVT